MDSGESIEIVREALLEKTVKAVETTDDGGCSLLMNDGTVVEFDHSVYGLWMRVK